MLESLPQIVETVAQANFLDYLIFAANRPDWLAEIKAIQPKAQTSILFLSPYLDPVVLAQSIQADYVHPTGSNPATLDSLLAGDWAARLREAGLGIIYGLEERPEMIAALQNLGVNGICSDTPERLLPQP
jgi:hypothetical protein